MIIKITENEAGQRLDRYIGKLLKKASKSTVQKLIRKKKIKVNGKRAEEKYVLMLGDEVRMYLSDATLNEWLEEKREITVKADFEILYEDDDILCVEKKAGISIIPDIKSSGNSLTDMVQGYLSDLITPTFKPSPIHRLDKNTSGVVVFAKNYQTARKMSEMMQKKEIKKYYLAVVNGKIERGGTVSGFIVKD